MISFACLEYKLCNRVLEQLEFVDKELKDRWTRENECSHVLIKQGKHKDVVRLSRKMLTGCANIA